MTPPLRPKWHQEKLWEGLRRDDLQVVSTDHCPFCFKEQKEMGVGDFTQIPTRAQGIVIFDPNKEVVLSAKTPHMKVDYNPYEGMRVLGAPSAVLVRGKPVIESDQFVGRVGSGPFL